MAKKSDQDKRTSHHRTPKQSARVANRSARVADSAGVRLDPLKAYRLPTSSARLHHRKRERTLSAGEQPKKHHRKQARKKSK